MDTSRNQSRGSTDASRNGPSRRIGASADAPYGGCGAEDALYVGHTGRVDSATAKLPTFDAIGAVVRRASLIATAVHSCERASADARMRRLSAILPAEGHP